MTQVSRARGRVGLLLLTAFLTRSAPIHADEPSFSAEALEFFEHEAFPVLQKRCFKCHDARGEPKSHFRVTTRAGLVRGGDRGPAVNLAEPGKSLLLRVISYDDPDLQMPPSGKLPARESAVLARWIELGAPFDPKHEIHGEEKADEFDPTEVNERTKDYWAFRPIAKPRVPEVPDAAWSKNPIDAFIYRAVSEKRGASGLVPNPPADRRELIRRATYDLIGLPPTLEEVEAFVADDSPDAFAKVVDRLLDSPHHGEKWARHWLDLVRYAESNGYERDSVKPMAWRYRDYVVKAFNQDKPYDRFLVEQLAGDELDDADADSITATGYYRLGLWDDEPADRELATYDYLDSILSTTGEAMLGLTVGCARCHDHKIDPIPSRDYYSLLSFLRNISPHGKGKTNLVSIASEDDRARSDLAAGRRQERRAETSMAMAVAERGRFKTHVLKRGNPRLIGDEVEPRFPSVLTDAKPTIRDRGESSGRRSALAEWIASPTNPLTARVMANRIWQFHFGRGIVRSPSNFGRIGERPTHPELLDWLATAFIESGWSIKSMHRLIMSSRAYQMSSRSHEKGVTVDASNDLFWRFNPRRLTAEELRDSMLSASGRLSLTIGGESVFPELPPEVLATSSTGAGKWGKSSPEERNRRSLYVFVRRSLKDPMLTTFDFADTDSPCAVRFSTTVPSQALLLLNSKFVNEQAEALGKRVREEVGDDVETRIRRVFELTLSRRPFRDEIDRARSFMRDLEKRSGISADDAFDRFALLALNLNEFVFVD